MAEKGEQPRGERLSEMPTGEKAAAVRRLRAEGMTWEEIKALVANEVTAPVATETLAAVVLKRGRSLG